MSFSIRDRNPSIFFNATLSGHKFEYDGTKYNSIFECFNTRKISNKYWNPSSVPDVHMANMDSVIGFLCESRYNTAYKMDIDVNDKMYKVAYNQFKTIVCAYLFRSYFRQVMSSICHDDIKTLVSKFGDAYSYCCKLVSGITLTEYKLDLTEYYLDESYSECYLVCNNLTNDISQIGIYNKVTMSMDTFKALSKRGYYWYNKICDKTSVEVICVDDNEYNDYYWELVKNSGISINITKGVLGYNRFYTVIIGSDCVESVKSLVDWNKVYVMR